MQNVHNPNSVIFLLIFIILCSCSNKVKDPMMEEQKSYFSSIAENDMPMTAPQKGDWLYEHHEAGQYFEAYLKISPVTPDKKRTVIYLMPVGSFTPLQEKALRAARDYTATFFQLKTVLANPISDTSLPASAQRIIEGIDTQLRAPYILDSVLKPVIPANSLALLAISAKDLFPQNNWNYVFGLASYANGVGVSSIYRLQNRKLTTDNYHLCLQRLIKIVAHEIGHMLSMQHCTYARCIMNGSNSMYETDKTPNRLCSECQKKLYSAIRYNNKQRLTQLCDFFSTNGLITDDKLLKKDLN